MSLPCWDSRFRGRRGKHGERQGFSRSSQPAEGSGGVLGRANEEFRKAPGASRFESCTCESALPQLPTVGAVPFWENPVSGVSCACLDDCKRGPLCCQPLWGRFPSFQRSTDPQPTSSAILTAVERHRKVVGSGAGKDGSGFPRDDQLYRFHSWQTFAESALAFAGKGNCGGLSSSGSWDHAASRSLPRLGWGRESEE